MIPVVESYVRRGKQYLGKLALYPGVWTTLRGIGYVLGGFFLAPAGLSNLPQPIAMGYVCGCHGGGAFLAALGSIAGYLWFWGSAGYQAVVWVLGALAVSLFIGKQPLQNQTPLLLPAAAGLVVSAAGVFFQTWLQDSTPVGMYLLRVGLGAGTAWLSKEVLSRRNPILDWLAGSLWVLALAQVMPVSYCNLGFVAGGLLAVRGAFPAAALAGLALDLSGVSPVPVTAVLSASFFLRFLPRYPKWVGVLAPGLVYLVVAGLTKTWDLYPVPSLLIGAVLGQVLPGNPVVPARRGETGVAQVRLEMASGALLQTQQLLLEAPQVPVDEAALVERAAEEACHSCPCRKGCKDSRKLVRLPAALLYKPLLSVDELPVICKKASRFLAELHRSQEQLRSICADRQRQAEYRAAVIQQYRFLGEYLRELSDQLAQKSQNQTPCYEAHVEIYANRPQEENGDRCSMFAGVRSKYYVMLCDGMGTGLGAVQEGQTAVLLLKKMLTAGYPANHALESLNSICALRSRAGAVTVDLLELELTTGKATIYKWGAAPSYLITGLGVEKIGTAGPPPGISVAEQIGDGRRLSLRRGELLMMVSDGVGEEEALHRCMKLADRPPGEMAKALLTCSETAGEDDATVVCVSLRPGHPSA